MHYEAIPTEREEKEDIFLRMQLTEARYGFEKELMKTVSKGLSHRAEQMFSNSAQRFMEQRVEDPLRNMKNYCIICDTLLRKAAEQGGVHPVYLDDASSAFAREIESVNSLPAGQDMMFKMIRSYCRLVKKHATEHYSPPVQKAIACIDADLSVDLSLNALASMQGINASYLSTLFKRETGRTVTDYVNRRRVDQATHLLSGTKLQIQMIAQHCGVSDVNYFSKMFKKYMGITPKEYRIETAAKQANKE